MNHNVRIAKKLIRIAKELVAVPSDTYDGFAEFNQSYQQKYGKPADSSIWDLFNTEEEKEAFLKAKSQAHPNLSEFMDKKTLRKILDEGYFTICSVGISTDEHIALTKKYTDANGDFDSDGYESEKKSLVQSRRDELCKFLDGLNVKYCEVLGQFYDEESKKELAELSYLVDLTSIGKNNDEQAKEILRKISSFCGSNMNQTAVIEGIKGAGAYVYCGDRSHRIKQPGMGDTGYGRSTVRNDSKNRTDWSDNYDWDDSGLVKKDWTK